MQQEDVAARANAECSEALEKAAHQLASLAQAYNELAQHGPRALQDGAVVLKACEDELKRLAKRKA